MTELLTTDKDAKRSESQPEKPEPSPMSPAQVQDSDLEQEVGADQEESTPVRAENDRYGLRRVSPPTRLMQVGMSARDELVEERGVI